MRPDLDSAAIECERLARLLTERLDVIAETRRNARGEYVVRLPGRANAYRVAEHVVRYLPTCCFYKLKHVRLPHGRRAA